MRRRAAAARDPVDVRARRSRVTDDTVGEHRGLASSAHNSHHRARMEDMTGAPGTGETPSEQVVRCDGEAAGERRHLLVFRGTSSWIYPLPACGDVVIGRSEAADLRIDHGAVSRRHARLVLDGDAVSV